MKLAPAAPSPRGKNLIPRVEIKDPLQLDEVKTCRIIVITRSEQMADQRCSTSTPNFTFGIPARTAQGGGRSFKDRRPIGEVWCCEPRMAEQIH